ncbi:MAG: cytochrome b562 [Thalassotalea sp.]|nr:cytochrome b562 [Thalassotalea sp.]
MKKFIFAIPLIALTFMTSVTISTPVHAAQKVDKDSAVSTNFKDIGRTMRKLRRAKTGKDVAKNLEKIKKLTVKNSNLMPSFAPQGSAELKTYKTEVDKMIEGIDTMIAQANAGELTKGSDALKQLKTLKEDGHKALDMKD